jgi:hypothetical protein
MSREKWCRDVCAKLLSWREWMTRRSASHGLNGRVLFIDIAGYSKLTTERNRKPRLSQLRVDSGNIFYLL